MPVSLAIVGQTLLAFALLSFLLQCFSRSKAQRTAMFAAALAAISAFAVLAFAFLTGDYTLATVYGNSANLTPTIYKFTATWGNHEGSLALLAALIGLYGVKTSFADLSDGLRGLALGILGGVGAVLTLYMTLTSNPFATLNFTPADGRGFNPLLQDIGLAIHPPLLYVGYIGLAAPFSLALAGLWRGDIDARWAENIRKHTLFAWSFLTAGIALGSWWAYRELGWGGFWFWDPVENASLMPWLAATAVLHAAGLTRRRNSCALWTAALALTSFWLVVTGFFLVRSGVVTSVHSFASDPKRGLFILAMVAATLIASLAGFFMWRKRTRQKGRAINITPGDVGILAQTLWMCVATSTILLATLYPLIIESITGHKIAVGAPYFNRVFLFLTPPLLAATAILPALPKIRGEMLIFLAATFACAGALATSSPLPPVLFIASFSLALGGAVAALTTSGVAYALKTLSPRLFRMQAAHFGMFVLFCGIFIAAFLQEEDEFVVNPGDRVGVSGYELAFEKMERVRGDNFLALRGVFSAYDGMKYIGNMQAEARFYPQEGTQTAESSVIRLPAADLYLAMGEALPTGEAGIRLQYKPGVPLIWTGAIIMALAGITGIRANKE